MTGPIIETERLILRVPQEQDLGGWAEFMADAQASRFLGGAQPRAVAWRAMATMTGAWTLKGFSMFSVIEKESGTWIGRLGPWQPEGWPGTEIGWGIHPAHWGKGYAIEGAAAAIGWAFEHLGWSEVIHCIDPENEASIRVAQRLGSAERGPGLLPPPLDHWPIRIWGQSRQQWLERAERR